jgi:hypothetical protein
MKAKKGQSRLERIKLSDAERRETACSDCASQVIAIKVGVALVVTVAHDDTCPWFRAFQDGAA